MAAIFAFLLIVVTAIAFAIVLDRDAGEMIPVTVFSITAYLYLFYCANILRWGVISLYLIMGILLFYAAYRAGKEKIHIVNKITPAVVVFLCTGLFFFIYSSDNRSVNWDELRVWSAMPKAIFETKQLQLGYSALIFDSADNMQSYPPALPLFSNFLMSLSPDFSESIIFFAYSVFVASITIAPFTTLRWKDWWIMPVAAAFVLLAPFVMTLHGGDNSYFYESLFIDPVLGFAAGYVFYLATSKPFGSKFDIIRFALALSVLVCIKDSGILFAFLSLLGALCIRRAEEKTSFAILARDVILPAGLMGLFYLIWKGLLQHYGIVNHVSMKIGLPAMPVLRAITEVLLRAPIINLIVFGFSFAVFAALLLILCVLIEKFLKLHSTVNNTCSLLIAGISFLLFAFGYINIFPYGTTQHLLDLSYYRYFTTLTSGFLIFFFLRYFPVLFEILPVKAAAIKITALVMGLCLCAGSVFVLCYWETNYAEKKYLAQAQQEKETILQQIPVDSNLPHQRIYLLMAEKEPNIFHHRFYFELIGTGLNVENYYIDTDMHDVKGKSTAPVEETAEKWYARLQKDGYDYIYVHSVDEDITKAFAHLGLGEAVAGRVYGINN